MVRSDSVVNKGAGQTASHHMNDQHPTTPLLLNGGGGGGGGGGYGGGGGGGDIEGAYGYSVPANISNLEDDRYTIATFRESDTINSALTSRGVMGLYCPMDSGRPVPPSTDPSTAPSLASTDTPGRVRTESTAALKLDESQADTAAAAASSAPAKIAFSPLPPRGRGGSKSRNRVVSGAGGSSRRTLDRGLSVQDNHFTLRLDPRLSQIQIITTPRSVPGIGLDLSDTNSSPRSSSQDRESHDAVSSASLGRPSTDLLPAGDQRDEGRQRAGTTLSQRSEVNQ